MDSWTASATAMEPRAALESGPASFGTALPLTALPSIVVISDFVEGWPPNPVAQRTIAASTEAWADRLNGEPFGPSENLSTSRDKLDVVGGYLERLPLACIKAGLVDHAEIWHHW